ncbi:MAG: pyridoxine 5'-phosphate synthase [Chlorobium sp.]|uniref:pyridoxine 5'-phosphate synthase n=1 Tax=Chlorobium sp. TaxID=1095 RepID=UPI0025BA691F|nr:pyridoxine 5'-phosphate synthase [Chlorobium sp.]MCF8216850.1 pyridoxine 5'-phosphate synthase [Chlorobium sp.]MCF8271695.1 pyridoxine 5'-phosphate synthase [Chlorobium sp.]MCF8288067.1 pyridoxine 5'-phosphate synthase [Chlorobium sp.]MCF8291651.1 pyridoxine 5'-phosphate synthase [Chlorobium sp.]MCF8385766.1 pyridoxine 5'-phosphate synthase [Chlorobium sp.]
MRLAVNIDHIATLRNARNEYDPDPAEAALLAEKSGAAGIVCHLREDRRHIRDLDLQRLRQVVTTKLDLEMAMTEEMQAIALRTKPELVTLVPENREELTTEGGFNITRHFNALTEYIKPFRDASIAFSIFIEPDERAIELAGKAGADIVELHTGIYSLKETDQEREKELKKIRHAARFARSLNLEVVAGHGLNYKNSAPFAAIEEIEEVSIGHAIIARAAFTGLESAIREMIKLLGGEG